MRTKRPSRSAYVVQGELVVGLFAVLLYDSMVHLEARRARGAGR